MSDNPYEGMLKEPPSGHTKKPSPAQSSISNMQGASLPFLVGNAPDFLKSVGIVTATDEQIMAAASDEEQLLQKLKKKTIREGSVVVHIGRGDKYVVLKTNIDIAASGSPRHLVVHSKTHQKYKIAATLLKAE